MTDQKKPASLLEAMFHVQQNAPSISKSVDNPFFKSKYADLAVIWDAIRPLMGEANLLISHHTKSIEGKEYLVTRITHVSTGQFTESECLLHLQKPTSQEYGSCVTYMRRYSVTSMLGLVTDKDDDGNAASKEKKEKTPSLAPFDKTGNKAIDNAVKQALQAIVNCVDTTAVKDVGRYQYKLLKESGATDEQLDLIHQQVENTISFISAKGN